MPRLTSLSHPLQIATIEIAEGFGQIGVTFCPGKKDKTSMSGEWDRDLGLDLDAIAHWGAVAVVTLIEGFELELLNVGTLGEDVERRHMRWYHLPIKDVSTPGETFEQEWLIAGAELRALLGDGGNVLVHCRGGIGRAGTIAARLLVELGVEPREAIRRVRAKRKGAIETMMQERHVLTQGAATTPEPGTDAANMKDRALGAFLGLAVGDAVGTTLEFKPRDDKAARLTDMIGGGPFGLSAGQWTDDTAMALALAESLLADPHLDPRDLMGRFVRWWKKGDYSVTGKCFDIGNTTRAALQQFLDTDEPLGGSTSPRAAGNGSLMRLSPVAIRHWQDAEARRSVAAVQSRTTHAANEAVDACILYTDMIAEAIAGKARNAILAPRVFSGAPKITAIAAGEWRNKSRHQIKGCGYVVDALEAAIWCVARTTNVRDAILMAANLRDDADTTAAIAGQLAGALYGASAIPADWLAKLAWRERIETLGSELFEASMRGG